MEPPTFTMSREDTAEGTLLEVNSSSIMGGSGAMTPPLRESRKASAGYMRYSWPRGEH